MKNSKMRFLKSFNPNHDNEVYINPTSFIVCDMVKQIRYFRPLKDKQWSTLLTGSCYYSYVVWFSHVSKHSQTLKGRYFYQTLCDKYSPVLLFP